MPRISVVIPAYKNGELLSRCVNGILRQSCSDWEVIIVNDASPDNTSEIAHSYEERDERFRVIDIKVNGGLHLARMAGTEMAAGDYLLYLDADDELVGDDLFSKLLVVASNNDADIIRFGLMVQAENGVPESAAKGFTQWSNASSGPLFANQITEAVFHEEHGFKIPWNMTHRLFDTELVKRAFRNMVKHRLERAEDAYEFLVTSSLAHCELDCCELIGYLYHMGIGVTNAKALSTELFLREASAMKDCYDAAIAYASTFSDRELSIAALGLKHKLLEAMGNDLNERVVSSDREKAEQLFENLVGSAEAACEYYRFLRDLSWQYLVRDCIPTSDDKVFHLETLADTALHNATDNMEIQRCGLSKALSHEYMTELERRISRENEDRDIRIFASTHRRAQAFDSSIIDLIQVGSTLSSERYWETIHDDSGDNISNLNHEYCELTAQYWAWKNIDAEYYGFCHYRRYFDFSGESHVENPWGEVIAQAIDESSQKRFGLDDASIRDAVNGWDIITTRSHDLTRFENGFRNPYHHWQAASELKDQDFINMMALVVERHPDYAIDVEEYTHGSYSCFCNMFIMRKSEFFDYCEWLFPLLSDFMQLTDMSKYSREARRTPGHLAERLLNIYLMHRKRMNPDLRVKEVQCVHFLEVDRFFGPQQVSSQIAGYRPIIPVVLAADNKYVPMLTTTIYSMLKNASSDYYYHVVVLTTDISSDNQRIMRDCLCAIVPCTIDIVYVRSLIRGYQLTTSNKHIGIETYYRFLIQDVLPYYEKVLYLDSDLIIEGDVSELFTTDIGNNLLGAVIDVDYLGNLNIGDERMAYSVNELRMDDPYSYFQAGVLVMNTYELKKMHSVCDWLSIAQNPSYIYNDQDILNAYCEGRVVYLDPSWNVLIDGCNRIEAACSHAPAQVFSDYLESRKHEKVIHYAGGEKPWNASDCDRADRYWLYARETPFYEQLLITGCAQLTVSSLRQRAMRAAKNTIKAYANHVAPPESKRRDALLPLYYRLRHHFGV